MSSIKRKWWDVNWKPGSPHRCVSQPSPSTTAMASIRGESIGADFLEEISVIRYAWKKKAEVPVQLSFKHETYELICHVNKSGTVKVDCAGKFDTNPMQHV